MRRSLSVSTSSEVTKVAAQILVTEDVAEIKTLGRLVSGYDESLWNGVRQIVVYEGLLAKFSQNSESWEQLKKQEALFLPNVRRRIGYGASVCPCTTLTDLTAQNGRGKTCWVMPL